VKEVFDTAFVTNKAKTLVDQQTRNGAVRHTFPPPVCDFAPIDRNRIPLSCTMLSLAI
jgi:hypothetical protein